MRRGTVADLRRGQGAGPDEIRAWDISISPTGKELPPGHGTAKEGAPLFARKGAEGATVATDRGPRADVDQERRHGDRRSLVSRRA